MYVQYEVDSGYSAPAPSSTSITAREGDRNETTYEESSNAHMAHFMTSGIARINVSNKAMSTTYTDSNISRLKSDIKDAGKRISAATVLGMTMEQEGEGNGDFSKVKSSMPKDLGLP